MKRRTLRAAIAAAAAVATAGAVGPIAANAATSAPVPPPPPIRGIATCTATPCTPSSPRSSTSQLFNNWNDLVGIAQNAVLYPKDTNRYGPTLAELHYKGDWATNQIQSETAYLGGISAQRATPPSSDADLAFDRGGILHHDYLNYNGVAAPVQIKKKYVAVPGQEFIVLEYDLKNTTGSATSFNFMDHVELSNKTLPTGGSFPSLPDPVTTKNETATYNAAQRGYDVDMTATGQFHLSVAAFEDMDSHGVGSFIAGPNTPGNPFQTVVRDFNSKGTLNNAASLTAPVLSIGLQKRVTLAAGATTTLSFAYTVQGTAAAASSAITTALSRTPSAWETAERSRYEQWLKSGQRSHQSDQGVNSAFDISLITLKQSQQPEFGSWVAATSPAYDYKVWPRDAAVTAMSMDATGHTAEADKYYRWMASVQLKTKPSDAPLFPGTWYTNYDYWQQNRPIRFVEPEFDSTGLFIHGAYVHYQTLLKTDPAAAQSFITATDVHDAIVRGADWINDNIDPVLGFGPQDQSIWEERYEIATFTQATYVAGLRDASKVMDVLHDNVLRDRYKASAAVITASIMRPANTPGKPGMWFDPTASGNPPIGCVATPTFHGPNCNAPYPSTGDPQPYFLRGIFNGGGETPNNDPKISLDEDVDSSVGILWVLGIIDPNSSQAKAEQAKMIKWLGKGEFGISRHENDDFYFSSVYSPGGQYESNVPDPVWPQPVMYNSILETWQGNVARAQGRLRYYASVTPVGYEPPGEAVDWSNNLPLISTASEPVTGAWFMLATMVNEGRFDTRATAP